MATGGNEADIRAQLREALERESATTAVLQAISESGADLTPMLNRLLAEAARICRADLGFLYLFQVGRDGQLALNTVIPHNVPESISEANRSTAFETARDFHAGRVSQDERQPLAARVYLEGHTIHVPDATTDPVHATQRLVRDLGMRAALGVPMHRGNEHRGTITLWKREPGPFNESAIKLVERFAYQAFLAIENVRLPNEMREALDRQKAISDVLQSISRTAFDLEAVLSTVKGAMRAV